MSDRPVPHVWQAALATSWAMLPERLAVVFEIAARENLDLEAVAAKLGRPLDNARAVAVRPGGVAVIPIEGVIFPRASLFSAISGGVSADELATDLAAALDDPGVSGIVLAVDSPGGDVNGVAEVAAMIRAGAARKPIVAYVRDLGASAAYWLAAAADEVVVASTALVGSIGVIGAVPDPTKQSSRSIEFVSSQSPHKRPDPTTEKGSARIQARVDEIAAIFIADVARYRGVDAATVAADFGQGDVLIGQAAVDAGLADRVGSFEGVVAELQQRARESRRIPAGRMAAQHTEGVMAQEQPKGRMDRFMAWLGGEGDDSAFVGANIAASGTVGTPRLVLDNRSKDYIPDNTPSPQRDDPRLAEALAELARMKAAEQERAGAAIEGEAVAFASRIVGAGKALPVEQTHLAALYRLAAADDAAHGAVTASDGTLTTRVAALAAWQEARPTGALLGELVPVQANADGTLAVLDNPQTTDYASGEANDKPMTEEQRIKVMAMTDTGRAELKRRGIPIPVVPVQ
jgi:signal peptide peptidase SppA